jgi:hypothetical protein
MKYKGKSASGKVSFDLIKDIGHGSSVFFLPTLMYPPATPRRVLMSYNHYSIQPRARHSYAENSKARDEENAGPWCFQSTSRLLCYQYDTYKLIHTYAWSRGGSKHNKT